MNDFLEYRDAKGREIERRLVALSGIRANDPNETPSISGHAAVFNEWSVDLGFMGELREEVAPGAFTDTLTKIDQRMLFNHDSNFVLGRKSAKTLELNEDSKGLAYLNYPPNTNWANDLLVSIKRGDINQMSFAFVAVEDAWRYDRETQITYRTLLKVDLYEVSLVTFPAYPQTSANVRARVQGLRDEARSGLAPAQPSLVQEHIGMARRKLALLEIE